MTSGDSEGKPMFKRMALIGIGLIGSSISHAARRAGINRVFGGIAGAILAMIAVFQGALEKTFGGIDWDGIGKSINRALNMGVSAVISFFLLLVRLVLPGSAIGSKITRR